MKTETQGGHVVTEAETGAKQPPAEKPRTDGHPQKLEEAGRVLPRTSEGAWPASPSVLDF